LARIHEANHVWEWANVQKLRINERLWDDLGIHSFETRGGTDGHRAGARHESGHPRQDYDAPVRGRASHAEN
jgi:hypothetical protein